MKSIFIALVLLFTVGCATIEENPNTANLIGFVATNEYIKKIDGESERAQRSARIIEAARAAQRAAAGEIVTVTLVEEAIRANIDWDSLTPADFYQANMLISLIGDEVRNRVGEGVLKIDEIVAVSAVLENVIMAAKFYVE